MNIDTYAFCMDEQILLYFSCILALLGIVSLAYIPEVAPIQTYGVLTWTDGTSGLLVYEESLWIQTQHPILFSTPQCVAITGRISQERIVDARITSADGSWC